MSPPVFAKLFDTPHGQLLVTRDFEGDDGDELVIVRGAGLPGYKAETQYRYDHAAEADQAFEAFSQDDADRVGRALTTILADMIA